MTIRSGGWVAAAFVAGVLTVGVLSRAGDLNPPAGPVAPTMKTLAELSDEHAALSAQMAALSPAGLKRVVRGVVTLEIGQYVASKPLGATINPERSIVHLNDAVIVHVDGSFNTNLHIRNASSLVSLTTDEITVRTDLQNGVRRDIAYQIVEYE